MGRSPEFGTRPRSSILRRGTKLAALTLAVAGVAGCGEGTSASSSQGPTGTTGTTELTVPQGTTGTVPPESTATTVQSDAYTTLNTAMASYNASGNYDLVSHDGTGNQSFALNVPPDTGSIQFAAICEGPPQLYVYNGSTGGELTVPCDGQPHSSSWDALPPGKEFVSIGNQPHLTSLGETTPPQWFVLAVSNVNGARLDPYGQLH